jgi:hypothetical protein
MSFDRCTDQEIARYTCYRTRKPLVHAESLDGSLSAPAWQRAPKSPRFVDVIGGTPALYDSRAAALWDDDYLYIGFWCEEPFVRAAMTERDSLIFLENDVEVFIDGGDTYYEFEINALGTVYEVFYIWGDAYQPGSKYDVPEFDIRQRNVRTFGGNHDRTGGYFWKGSHPRQNRWAFLDWDLPGLKTAVHVEGALNDDSVVDKGWTVALAFPWAGMTWVANRRALPPREGDTWGIFMGRYEQLRVNGEAISVGWAWNRIGTNDNHLPECFTQMQFSETYVEDL